MECVRAFEAGELELEAGKLLLIHANPRASAEKRRWSKGGVDLNRCFHRDVLARDPVLFEESRAREIVTALRDHGTEILVDFHCTVEAGPRFLMQHPPVSDAAHRSVFELLQGEVLLSDPEMNFGGVSLDEWMSSRARVGICYETGWIHDPANTQESVYAEMRNVLIGTGLFGGECARYRDKKTLQLEDVLICSGDGFRWDEGVGVNLQELAAGTRLGAYSDGTPAVLEKEATLVFPKKKPELVKLGQPLVYIARRKD
jgi:predicted deacylase